MKQRLDELLVSRNLAPTLPLARSLIGAGLVRVNGELADKAGIQYSGSTTVTIKDSCPYVSRGGLKLAGGLSAFSCDPAGMICADIGASTGGFTDCLLQNGASRVYAVDVSYGQLDWKLRQDPRVIVIERFNARKISRTEIPDPLDLAVLDSSFISLTRLIPPLLPLFTDSVRIIALIKPQFELPRDKIPTGGVVTDPTHHEEAIAKIQSFARDLGLTCRGVVRSPINGPKGNTEFLIHLTSGARCT